MTGQGRPGEARPGSACVCAPAWPGLVVHLDDGSSVEVVPAATAGALASLYNARCTGCYAAYPHPFRVGAARDAA